MKQIAIRVGMLSILALSLLSACSQDDSAEEENNIESSDLVAEESRQTAEAESTADAVLGMIDIAFDEQEDRSAVQESFFSDCVSVTVSSENEVVFITLDFGLGCELSNGALVSGKINLTYGPVQAGTATITYNLEDFTYNQKAVQGGGSIFRQRENTNGNPQSTANKELLITFLNGVTATVDGTRVSEWIEGVGSGTWRDNAFLVTGNREVVFSSGFTHTAQVVQPLRREATCPFFVSGELAITRNAGEATIDFGDGTCDNQAVLIVNGQETTIILRR